MADNSLQAMRILIGNASTVISNLDNTYVVKPYSQVSELKRGQYSVNIVPDNITTRDLTGSRSLADITIYVVFYYVMDSNDVYSEKWDGFLDKADEILDSLYQKENIPEPVTTVKIGIEFDNSLVNDARYNLISVVMSCEYNKFAAT